MFPTMMMNPWNNLAQSEHAHLVEKYQNVCLQVTYLSQIIKNLEEKLEKKQEPKKAYKRCRFFNTGFCKIERIVHSNTLRIYAKSTFHLESVQTSEAACKDTLENVCTLIQQEAVCTDLVVLTFTKKTVAPMKTTSMKKMPATLPS